MKPHRPVLLVPAALLAVAAGCGGGGGSGDASRSKQEYRRDVQSIVASMQTSMKSSLTTSPTGRHTTLPAYGLALSKTMSSAAARLARLEPPPDAAEDNAKLVAGLRFAGRRLREAPNVTTPKDAKAYATFFRNLLRSAPFRAMAAAVTDLEKKGYELGRLSGSVGIGSGNSTTEPPAPPQAQPVRPIRFQLVGRSGTQEAIRLESSFCPPHPGNTSCSFTLHTQLPTGPIPGALSVVRPGERVRVVAGKPITFVVGFAHKLCSGGLGPSVKGSALAGRTWKVGLPPGRYVVNVSFLRPSASGQVSENGVVGLLISRTRPLGIVPHPHCG